MSSSATNDTLDLLHRAEEARAMADCIHDPGARKTFIGVAETYEALAKGLERALRTLPAKPGEQGCAARFV